MADAKVLEFGLGLDFSLMSFTDLAEHLEQYLERAKNLPDLDRLIKALNPALKDNRYSEEERHELKKLRQRAYDRRRHSKFQNLESVRAANPESDSKSDLILETDFGRKTSSKVATPTLHPSTPLIAAACTASALFPQDAPPSDEPPETMPAQHKPPQFCSSDTTFWSGAKHAFASIDGEQVVRRLPAMLLLLGSTLLVSWLLWLQSVDLYKAIGFSSPQLTAAGSLLMVVGFAGIHALARSKLALLLCIYAGAYEGCFMVSGTLQDEKIQRVAAVDTDSDLRFLRDKLERARTIYAAANGRYQDQGSDVFMNSWFKKKHLEPAWSALEAAQDETNARLNVLAASNSRTDVTVLKVLYRLGIVLLSMILVHWLCRTSICASRSAIM